MGRKVLTGILVMMMLLPACGTAGREGAVQEIESQDPENRNMEGQGIENQSMGSQDIEKRNTGNQDIGNRNMETQDIENRNTGNQDIGNQASDNTDTEDSNTEDSNREGLNAESPETEEVRTGGSGSETSFAEKADISKDAASGENAGSGTAGNAGSAAGAEEVCRKAYSRILAKEDGAGNAVVYSLIYVDNDEIPELVVWDRGYGMYSIYTIKDGEAFCMMDSVVTVELTYYEKNGIVALFARWMGGGDEGGYGWYYYELTEDKTITDEDPPLLHFIYEASYDEDGNWSGGGVSRYYHMEQEVDETAYREMASSLGIVEGEGKNCTDNALEKKEMMEVLGF